MEYIYVVTEKDWRGVTVFAAYRSRRKAFRTAADLADGHAYKTELIDKKFERPEAPVRVPKRNGRSAKKKRRK